MQPIHSHEFDLPQNSSLHGGEERGEMEEGEGQRPVNSAPMGTWRIEMLGCRPPVAGCSRISRKAVRYPVPGLKRFTVTKIARV